MAKENSGWGYTRIQGALRNLKHEIGRNTIKRILDRDPLFTEAFRGVLGESGIETVKLPAKSPNLNAYAERFVRSIKDECLSKIIPLGERHLRIAVTEYAEHYHRERITRGSGTS